MEITWVDLANKTKSCSSPPTSNTSDDNGKTFSEVYLNVVNVLAPKKTDSGSRLRLILVFQAASLSSKTPTNDTMLICGLQVEEIIVDSDTVFSYIAKLDSTGLVTPRHAQSTIISTLIESYIMSLKHYYRNIRIYVQSMAQKEYLFPLSKKLETKGYLSGVNLIKWWVKQLDKITAKDLKKYLTIPNGVMQQPEGWINGHPFKDGDSAKDAIHILQDDAVSKCLQRSLSQEDISVKVFWCLIEQAQQEFKNGDVGLLYMDFESDVKEYKIDANDGCCCWDGILDMLNLGDNPSTNPLTFETKQKAHESSLQLLQYLMKHNIPMKEIIMHVPEKQPLKRPNTDVVKPVVHVLAVKRRK